jgi:hypothetical protein
MVGLVIDHCPPEYPARNTQKVPFRIGRSFPAAAARLVWQQASIKFTQAAGFNGSSFAACRLCGGLCCKTFKLIQINSRGMRRA